MIKKLIALMTIFTLIYLPTAQAGSFGGGSSGSRPSVSTPSTSRPSTSTPSSSVSKPSTPSTASMPSQNSTYSSKGGFSNTTTAPSTGSTKPSTNSPNTYRSSTMTPSSSVRTSPTYYSNNVHWYTPSSWGTGFTSGLFLGSMLRPWGGYYGYGNAYGYYGFSWGAMIFDLIITIFIIWLFIFSVRRIRRR